MSKSTACRRRWLWIQELKYHELDIRFAKMASTKGWGRRNVYQEDAAGVLSPADFAGTKTFKIEGIPIRTPTVFLGEIRRLRPHPRQNGRRFGPGRYWPQLGYYRYRSAKVLLRESELAEFRYRRWDWTWRSVVSPNEALGCSYRLARGLFATSRRDIGS